MSATPTPAAEVIEATAAPPGTPAPRSINIPPPSKPDEPPPKLDTSIVSVPLQDVVFDTFGWGFLRLSEADDKAVEDLRDAIKSIYQPVYTSVEGGRWLRDDDMVLGYVSDSGACSYPVKILNFHEIVNDVIDGVPVLVSYCPLCASGVVYDRILDGRLLVLWQYQRPVRVGPGNVRPPDRLLLVPGTGRGHRRAVDRQAPGDAALGDDDVGPVEVAPGNYKRFLENEHVRVLEMNLKAGAKDVTHSHPDEAVYFVKGGKAKIHLPDGGAAEVEVPDGGVMWHEEWTHQVENAGSSAILAIIVESKGAS